MNVETNEQRIKARAKRGKWVRTSNPSLNLAIAMTLLRSKLLQKPPDLLETNAQRWKRKAKERNQELLMLRDELKELEVRLKERRRRPDDSVRQRRRVLDLNSEDEIEQLRTSVDFLVEICNSVSPISLYRGGNLRTQAMERGETSNSQEVILTSLLRQEQDIKEIKSILHDMATALDKLQVAQEQAQIRLPTSQTNVSNPVAQSQKPPSHPFPKPKKERAPPKHFTPLPLGQLLSTFVERKLITLRESCDSGSDAQFYVQHLIRKLGSAPNIGQRTLLSVSQRISVLADTSHFMDPFDDAFPNMHTSMFMMIQLTEFLISDYIQTWSSDDSFEDGLFGELLRSILQARKALELLEFRNGLYVLYMDRVTGELAKQVGQIKLSNIKPTLAENE
ncbi:hypothetical protein HHK36_013802 [Tetracentron sinense]|uniref:Uncharacterized protein n=1 Tax=Tetracentron sinense TaxID=13715 RepID=A0A835DHP6_TETSI|nr:hypothetical protein HHK36_013802 [Tetracentron sinense]